MMCDVRIAMYGSVKGLETSEKKRGRRKINKSRMQIQLSWIIQCTFTFCYFNILCLCYIISKLSKLTFSHGRDQS